MTTVFMVYLVVIPTSAKGLQGEGKSLSLLTSCGKTYMLRNRNVYFFQFLLFWHMLTDSGQGLKVRLE